jgi:hypothetical protein
VIATRPGVMVPETALRRSMVGADEVVVCDGNVARISAVAVGQRSELGVEITGGLKPGERIVIDHVLGIEDGQGLTAAGKAGGKKAAGEKADDEKADDKPADGEKAGDKKAGGKKADDTKSSGKPGAPGGEH